MEITHPLYGAKWVAATCEAVAPVIIRRFRQDTPGKAVLHITGLGYFHARINGKDVTDHRFQPVVSEYGPRDLSRFTYPLKDSFTHRIYFCSYDVTELLKTGENELRIWLGNGWYRQTERRDEGPMSFGDTLKTVFSLELPGERIVSDGSESWEESQIRYDNLFIGEVHDLGFVPGAQRPVTVLPDEAAILSPQIGAPDKIIRTLSPRLIRKSGNSRIYDTGENISGIVRLTASGAPGEEIRIRYAEGLTSEGALDFDSAGGNCVGASGRRQIQEDRCICGGSPALFEPRSCWHAFRYFEVEGPGEAPQVLVIHSDTPVTGCFRSDSEGLNFLFEAFLRTQLNNMHGSIPSDCPHRERLGYTGDGQVAAMAAMLTLDT